MRPGYIAGLVWLAAVAAAGPVRAEDAPQTPPADAHKACEVPNSVLATESRLPKVADAVKSGHAVDILVMGSRSSTIPGSETSAYPARLQAVSERGIAAGYHQYCPGNSPKKNRGGDGWRPR